MRFGENRFSAIVAGFVMALMLAVGMEALPFVAVAGAVLALSWVFESGTPREQENRSSALSRADESLTMFGLAFILALLALYPVGVPASAAFYCDAYSAAYLTAGIVGGAGIAGVSILARRASVLVRLAGLATVGLAALATIALFFPACLAGPMGNVSAELKAEWLSTVAEAQPLWSFAAVFSEEAFATFAAPLLATIFACRKALGRSEGMARRRWIIIAALLLVALAFAVYQYRGSLFLNALSIPVLAVWIAEWRQYVDEKIKDSGRAIAILLIWLSGLQVAYLSLANAVATAATLVTAPPVAEQSATVPAIKRADADATAAERECIDPWSAVTLAALPEGRILAPLFYGSTILALSGHSALTGPYHRAEGPILDTVRAEAGDDVTARSVIQRRNIDYVAICPTSKEALLLFQEKPAGFFSRLMLGRQPAWLEPVEAGESYLLIYKVRHEIVTN